MRYEHAYYLTKDRSLEVEFLLLHLGAARGWRAYILSDINYKRVSPTRSTAIYDVHRLTETRGERYIDAAKAYPYVCWNQTIHDLDTMKMSAPCGRRSRPTISATADPFPASSANFLHRG
jgi:hypothetical protein